MKTIALFGSTGSIGTQTLDVMRHHPDEFRLGSMAAMGNKRELIREQIREFRPQTVAVFREDIAAELASELKPEGIRVLSGMEGLVEMAAEPTTDFVVMAVSGLIGIEPTLAAIRAGKTVAQANKETLVCAGELVMTGVREQGTAFLPVDSEHSAIFQCLEGVNRDELKRILLTASGGPFRGFSREQLERVTPEQALRHPNWNMGPKVTIDSASLMNKGLEMIEARWLFDTMEITPIIHPQSIVHSLIEMKDGTVLAQLGVPDMRLPIEVALMYPKRGRAICEPLDLVKQGSLSFEAIDESVFPTVAMARCAMHRGGLFPAVFAAAGEVAVKRFLNKEIPFTGLFELPETAMNEYEKRGAGSAAYTLEEVLAVPREVERILSCKL